MSVMLSFEPAPMLQQPSLTETKIYINDAFVGVITHVYSSIRNSWDGGMYQLYIPPQCETLAQLYGIYKCTHQSFYYDPLEIEAFLVKSIKEPTHDNRREYFISEGKVIVKGYKT